VNALKTGILMTLIFALLLGVGALLGGQNGLIIGFVFALVTNGISYWFSDKIILAMYRAHPVTEQDVPRLHAIVKNLAASAGIPMPKVYVIDNPNPNAFATGRSPDHAAVAVTTGILNLLTEDQLAGVIAHELSHVQNRDILIATVAATVAGTISFLAMMARWSLMFTGGDRRGRDGNPLALIFVAIFAPLAAMFIQLWISRTREYGADARGAAIVGNPLYLADALERLERGVMRVPMQAGPATAHMFIVAPFKGRDMLSWFSTHPPIADRVARLRQMAEQQGIRTT
jgi:heat shock protein HtpX